MLDLRVSYIVDHTPTCRVDAWPTCMTSQAGHQHSSLHLHLVGLRLWHTRHCRRRLDFPTTHPSHPATSFPLVHIGANSNRIIVSPIENAPSALRPQTSAITSFPSSPPAFPSASPRHNVPPGNPPPTRLRFPAAVHLGRPP
jgi:hypothetical protein